MAQTLHCPASMSAALRVLVLSWLAIAVGIPPSSAAAAPLGICSDQGGVTVCSGKMASFDGSPLDADLTSPSGSSGPGPHPLIVLLHGFGNDKREWESTTDDGDGGDKWHWNNHWFASQGFYVLTYTARGFAGSASEPNGTIRLKSREFEMRDTQWLAAQVAATHEDLDPSRVAVSGGSYGGGETWLQASQPDWTFPHSQDPSLPILKLQVAVPKYPWTDLAYSLAPNGHGGGPDGRDPYESSQGRPRTGYGNPVGVLKESFTSGFIVLGVTRGIFETGMSTTPSEEGRIDLPAWFARMDAVGDPYEAPTGQDLDPVVAQVRRGLTLFRSAYYQPTSWQKQVNAREVAVFSMSGWTDDLFPALESFRQYKFLKRLDPSWPVQVGVADIGHARAQNPPQTWRTLNERAWRFVQDQIGGSHRAPTNVFSLPVLCSPNAAGAEISADTPEGLAHGQLTVAFATRQTLTSHGGAADPNGPATDPVAGSTLPFGKSGCRASNGPALGGYSGTSQPLARPLTYAGLGTVEVPYLFVGQTGQLDARMWDVAADGRTLLVSRGTYRIDVFGYDRPAGVLRLPLFGNHWRMETGHRIRLDLTQVDQPFLRPSTPTSSISFANPRLVLPIVEATAQVVNGQ